MPNMQIGYARTSTIEQVAGLEGQERDLRAAGCERVFAERVSSVAQRDQLEAAIGYPRWRRAGGDQARSPCAVGGGPTGDR